LSFCSVDCFIMLFSNFTTLSSIHLFLYYFYVEGGWMDVRSNLFISILFVYANLFAIRNMAVVRN
ncbi:hypothetical protein T12_6001, partial [Trichinella patagoniensis]